MPQPVPEDIYKHDVDFTALALQYPNFAKKLKSKRQLDFTDPESVKQLTLSLLHRDFNLTLHLPSNRLCPPVPNRFAYIVFIQHLLSSTNPNFRSTHDSTRSVLGIDIGTGASAIYPLLGCQQHPSWKFLCTEIDDSSRSCAQFNITLNSRDSRIKTLQTDPTSSQLIPTSALSQFPRIDFLMTNPPFYSSPEQLLASAKAKSRPPNSSCTGAPIEMIYPYYSTNSTSEPTTKPNSSLKPGGEIAFVTQLITESTTPPLRHRIQWFTALLGHLSSLHQLLPILIHTHHCTNYAVTTLTQGEHTRRWCLAWSWGTLRPPTILSRGVRVGSLEKKLLPFPSEFEFDVNDCREKDVGGSVDTILTQLESEEEDNNNKRPDSVSSRLTWQWKPKLNTGIGMAKADCWSRKVRRRRKEGRERETKDASGDTNRQEDEDEVNKEPALLFKITVKHDPGTVEAAATTTTVTVRWLQGNDSVLFESFCGWLKRKVEAR